MRLKDYGRKSGLRKEFVQNPNLLTIGVDISKGSHSACFGTRANVLTKKYDYANSRDGFQKFEAHIRSLCNRNACEQQSCEHVGFIDWLGKPV
jgi:hypothetical protein